MVRSVVARRENKNLFAETQAFVGQIFPKAKLAMANSRRKEIAGDKILLGRSWGMKWFGSYWCWGNLWRLSNLANLCWIPQCRHGRRECWSYLTDCCH